MLIKRAITIEIRGHLAKREITLIVGPRQAGKTTLMRELQKELVGATEKVAWLSLDFEEDRQFFVSQKALLKRIEYLIGTSGYVFVDEIQRLEDAGLFLKGLYDRETDYKWIVSGSGSLELKEKIGESLAGRKRMFELSTLTFAEFVAWKEDYRDEAHLLWKMYPEQVEEYLSEYRQFGGYPRVVTATTIEEKRQVIEEIYQSYLEKDLRQLLGVEKSESLTKLMRVLAAQIGQLVNYSELANSLDISIPTIKKYMWYMEKTYMIARVTPYFNNRRKEITKAPVYYFEDLGMANYAAGQFGIWRGVNRGFLAQNLVYLWQRERIKETPHTIHYWRTQDGAEVDFVIDKGEYIEPWEVKDSFLKKSELTRSYRSFLTKYQPKEGYIVSQGELPDEKVGVTVVHFVPLSRMSG